MRRWIWLWMAFLVGGPGCDDGDNGGANLGDDAVVGQTDAGATDAAAVDAGDETDAAPDAIVPTPDSAVVDAGVLTDAALVDAAPDGGGDEAPWIGEALADCRTTGGAGSTGAGNALSRVDVDLAVFPDAVCNDGTGAVFYVRRATTREAAGKWVIQLQGGGSCASGSACAGRYCKEGTNFAADKMSSAYAPERGTNARGILASRPENPFDGWNHVFVHYCSSDMWAGRQQAVDVDATHPTSGDPVRYRAAFQGSAIVDAVIDTLRRDGVGPVSQRGPDGALELPDLDAADEVVLAGASAGGAGVTFNLDRVATGLRAANDACDGDDCALRVWGLIDSIYGVSITRLDLTSSTLCTELNICAADDFLQADYAAKSALWSPSLDDTCEAWHATNQPGDAFRCVSNSYVIENHVTTPFVLRMGLTDSLIGENMASRGFTVPERGDAELTLELFAELVAERMRTLPDIGVTANEAAAVEAAPGVYGPRCPKHETISSDADTYDVRIDVDGRAISFPMLLTSSRAGGPSVAVTVDGERSVCP
ncbi:MAG: hypothetical protein ACI9U2_005159 [Bradymonadia bacterium]|jgi:hypothetical protein